MHVRCPNCNQINDVTGQAPDAVVYCRCGKPFRVPKTETIPVATATQSLGEPPAVSVPPPPQPPPVPQWTPPTPQWTPPVQAYPPPYTTQAPPGPYGPRRTVPGTAVASLILGICTFLCLGILGAIPAVILGYSARTTIDADPSRYEGRGMATAGFVLGWIGIAISVIAIVVLIVVAAAGSMN